MDSTRVFHTKHICKFKSDCTVPKYYKNLIGLGAGTYGIVCKADVSEIKVQEELGINFLDDDSDEETEFFETQTDYDSNKQSEHTELDSIPVVSEDWCFSGNFKTLQKNDLTVEKPVHVVIKRLHDPFHDRTIAKQVFREISILKHLTENRSEYNADNVSHFVEAFSPDDYQGNASNLKSLYLVAKFEGIDLTQVVNNIKYQTDYGKSFNLKVISYISYQLACGLNYIHTSDIVHRDLKPSNIVIDSDSSVPVVKIIDFGMARKIKGSINDDQDVSERLSDLTTYVQARAYRAPELLLDFRNSDFIYDKSIDIWSFGLVIIELIKGEPLFGSHYQQAGVTTCDHTFALIELLGKIPYYSDLPEGTRRGMVSFAKEELAKNSVSKLRQEVENCLSGRGFSDDDKAGEFVDLISDLLTYGPSRVTTSDILAHQFVADFRPDDFLENEEKPGVRIKLPWVKGFEVEEIKRMISENCL